MFGFARDSKTIIVKFNVHILFLQARKFEGSDNGVIGTFMNIDPVDKVIISACGVGDGKS
jgi:hypothetical protein